MHKKTDIQKRLRRIEGQIRGITQMVDDDRYCIDIIHQIHAARAALGRVEDAILHQHAQTCVQAAIQSGDSGAQSEKIDELIDLISKARR